MKQPSQRVKDILSKMTTEQKAIQLSCVVPSMVLDKGVFDASKAEKEMPKGVGRMTQFASGFTQGPKQAAEGYNAIQKYIIEKTGVPAELIAAIHWRESSGNFDTYLPHDKPAIFTVSPRTTCGINCYTLIPPAK